MTAEKWTSERFLSGKNTSLNGVTFGSWVSKRSNWRLLGGSCGDREAWRLRIRIEEVGVGWWLSLRFLAVRSRGVLPNLRSLARPAYFNPSPSCPKASQTAASPSPGPPPTDETANTAATFSRPCRFETADSRARIGRDPRRRGRLPSNWQGCRDRGPPGADGIWRRGGRCQGGVGWGACGGLCRGGGRRGIGG